MSLLNAERVTISYRHPEQLSRETPAVSISSQKCQQLDWGFLTLGRNPEQETNNLCWESQDFQKPEGA